MVEGKDASVLVSQIQPAGDLRAQVTDMGGGWLWFDREGASTRGALGDNGVGLSLALTRTGRHWELLASLRCVGQHVEAQGLGKTAVRGVIYAHRHVLNTFEQCVTPKRSAAP